VTTFENVDAVVYELLGVIPVAVVGGTTPVVVLITLVDLGPGVKVCTVAVVLT